MNAPLPKGNFDASIRDMLLPDVCALAMAKRRVDAFVENHSIAIVEAAPLVSVKKMMDLYFGQQAPFSVNTSKKNEFSDALALLSLEDWAEDDDTMILAVTNDRDWVTYCETPEKILSITKLPGALAHFNADVGFVTGGVSQKLVEGDRGDWTATIEAAV